MTNTETLTTAKRAFLALTFEDSIDKTKNNCIDVWANIVMLYEHKRSSFLLQWDKFPDKKCIEKVINIIKNTNKNLTKIDDIIRLIKIDKGILVTTNNYWHKQGLRELVEEYVSTEDESFLELSLILFPFNSLSKSMAENKFCIRIKDKEKLSAPLNYFFYGPVCEIKNEKKKLKELEKILNRNNDHPVELVFDNRLRDDKIMQDNIYLKYYHELPQFLEDSLETIFDTGIIYSCEN